VKRSGWRIKKTGRRPISKTEAVTSLGGKGKEGRKKGVRQGIHLQAQPQITQRERIIANGVEGDEGRQWSKKEEPR